MKNNWKKILCLVLVLMFTLSCNSMSSFATETEKKGNIDENLENKVDEKYADKFSQGSPWLDSSDMSIYDSALDAEEEKQDIEPEDPGIVEEYFSELIRNTASSLTNLLEDKIGASLDRVIYGRVGSGQPNRVNVYGYEFRSGNPYGVVGAICYQVLRSMIYVLMGIYFVFQLAKSAWGGRTAQSREELKSNFFLTFLKFSMLALMPYLLDLAIYFRDVFLFGIKEVTGTLITGGATLNLSKVFLLNAEGTGRFVDAAMYLGTVILVCYFAILYIATAIDTLICVIIYPFVCLLQSKRRDLVGNWLMRVLSNLLTPVFDAILLLIPLLTSMMLGNVIKGIAIVQLIMCSLIIPARMTIKSHLGLQNNERGGMLGALALLSMAKAAGSKIKGAFSNAKGVKEDYDNSRMHKELAEADEDENASLLHGYGGEGRRNEGLDEIDPGLTRNADLDEPEDGFHNTDRGVGGSYDNDIDGRNEFEGSLDRDQDDELDSDSTNPSKQVSANLDGENPESDPMDAEEESDAPVYRNLDDTNASRAEEAGVDGQLDRNQIIRNLDKAVDDKQQAINRLRSQKAGYQREEKDLQRQMLDHERGTSEYQALEKKRADAALGAARTEQKIAGQMQEMGQLKNQLKYLQGSGNTAPSEFEQRRAEILAKRANINNFEQPQFKNVLSNRQMQELYQKRAIANGVKGVAGMTGAFAGGMAVGASSIYLNPATTVMATMAGAVGGSALGRGAVDLGMVAGKTGRNAMASGQRIINQTARDVGTSMDFRTAYDSAPIMMPQVDNFDSPSAKPINSVEMTARARSDASDAVKQMVSNGAWKSSSVLAALQQANIETEKYVLELKESQGSRFTPQLEKAKRIELQTQVLVQEALANLGADYTKGTEQYAIVTEILTEKIQKIVEQKNRDIF